MYKSHKIKIYIKVKKKKKKKKILKLGFCQLSSKTLLFREKSLYTLLKNSDIRTFTESESTK